MFTLIGIAVGIFVLIALGVSGKLSVLAKGFAGMFVENLATTPTGAKAVYNDAIEKAQVNYNKANDANRQIVGEYEDLKAKVSKLSKGVEKKTNEALASKKAGRMDDAILLAEEREDLLAQLTGLQEDEPRMAAAVKEAEAINTATQRKLKELKKDQTRVVSKLESNEKMKAIYDDLDDLKRTTDTDKLLGSIKDKVTKGNQEIAGAKAIRNNSLDVNLESAETRARKASALSFLDELDKTPKN